MKHRLLVLLALAAGHSARADEAGRAELDRIDATAHVDDAHLVLRLVVRDPRGGESERTVEIWQKGDDRRLVRVAAPPRLRGVGLLVTHGDTLHLFLPRFPPARRVSGRGRGDAFMGTDLAIEDLGRLRWADRYDAVVAGEEDGLLHLELTPTGDAADASVGLWVGPDHVVRRMEARDERGRPTRRLVLSDVRPEGGVPMAHRIEATDLRRGRTTVAELVQADLDVELPDELFTVSSLENP